METTGSSGVAQNGAHSAAASDRAWTRGRASESSDLGGRGWKSCVRHRIRGQGLPKSDRLTPREAADSPSRRQSAPQESVTNIDSRVKSERALDRT